MQILTVHMSCKAAYRLICTRLPLCSLIQNVHTWWCSLSTKDRAAFALKNTKYYAFIWCVSCLLICLLCAQPFGTWCCLHTYLYSLYWPAQSACMHPESTVLSPLVTFWPFRTQAGVGPSERPCPREAEERGGVQHPCSEGSSASSPGRAPTGSKERGCASFSNCWTHVCC